MKKKLPFLIILIAIGSIAISCNKNNPTNTETTTSIEKAEITKENAASARLKIVDSIINEKKINSPYPNDFEVLSIKEIDSLTFTEVCDKLIESSKGSSKGTTFYIAPKIEEILKKLGATKEICSYIIRYRLRYRVSDINVKVTDFNIYLSNQNLLIADEEATDFDHNFEVQQIGVKLQLALEANERNNANQ